MLGNAMRKYVMSENKNGYGKQVQSVYNNRIKRYTKLALKDLAFLAQKLPEEQQAEIFNDENMKDLFRALLRLNATELTANKELLRKKRQRLLPLCYELISLLNDTNLAYLMAPIGSRYMIKDGGRLASLKTVYYRSMSSKDEEE